MGGHHRSRAHVPAAWAAGCWKGPYLNDWLTARPVGGSFLYVGTAGNPPIVRVAGVNSGRGPAAGGQDPDAVGSDAVGTVSKSGSPGTSISWFAVRS